MRVVIFAATVLCALTGMAGAEFFTPIQSFSSSKKEATMDFCRKGKILLYKGDCDTQPGTPSSERVSRTACADSSNLLTETLTTLYPNAEVSAMDGGAPEEVGKALSGIQTIGFAFIGKGKTDGGFMLSQEETLYPEPLMCPNVDFFAGLYSYSKYSKPFPAPKNMRRNVIARYELVTDIARTYQESWPAVCKPKLSFVYGMPTMAGLYKNHTLKFLAEMESLRQAQVEGSIPFICKQCNNLIQNRHPLAQLCPPASSFCSSPKIRKEVRELLEKNYCSVLRPDIKPKTEDGAQGN